MEDYIKQMMERVKKTMKERTTGPQTKPKPKIPEDGIQCNHCDNTGWVLVRSGDHDAMSHCPECWERRQVARRLKKSGVSQKIMNAIPWIPSMALGAIQQSG